MKKTIFLLLLSFAFSSICAQQVVNGGFEEYDVWFGDGVRYERPSGWLPVNASLGTDPIVDTVDGSAYSKSKGSYSGKYALELKGAEVPKRN